MAKGRIGASTQLVADSNLRDANRARRARAYYAGRRHDRKVNQDKVRLSEDLTSVILKKSS